MLKELKMKLDKLNKELSVYKDSVEIFDKSSLRYKLAISHNQKEIYQLIDHSTIYLFKILTILLLKILYILIYFGIKFMKESSIL